LNLAGLIQISIGAVLINNFVLARMLGLCPFLGVSKKLSSALGMGIAVTFVMAMASLCTWCADAFVLAPYGLEYLQTVVFILIIASLVQLVEMTVQKFSPLLYESLGIYLPLITTNCAVLGVALINTGTNPYSGRAFTFVEAFVNGTMSGVGFTVALVLMAGIREKLDLAPIAKPLEGLPIAFLTAGLIALAFLGFVGLGFSSFAAGG
jgi:electron transport complex protein RnfA